MRFREVNTVTSNDEYVRMRIYDGDLPASEGLVELLTLERAQHAATRAELIETRARMQEAASLIGLGLRTLHRRYGPSGRKAGWPKRK